MREEGEGHQTDMGALFFGGGGGGGGGGGVVSPFLWAHRNGKTLNSVIKMKYSHICLTQQLLYLSPSALISI